MAEEHYSLEFLTLEEAAAYLRVSRPTLRQLVNDRAVPVVLLGARTRRFRKRDLDAWAAKQAEQSVRPKARARG
jgi:excisionase family DNA binding protein